MSYLTQLLKDLSDEDIIKIVTKLGANKYKDTDGCIASRRLFDTCGVSYREFNKDVDKITINLNN